MRRLLILTTLLLAAGSAAASTVELEVAYRSADRVYIEGGSRLGLAPGTVLEVVRDGEVTARLEVAYVAAHSASCRVLESTVDPAPGDRVLWRVPETALARRGGDRPASTASAQAPDYSSEAPERRRLRPDFGGSFSIDFEQYTDDSGFDRDYDRTAGRVNLRGRNLGGAPVHLRLRGSTRSLDRVVRADGTTRSETRDRLYELSLAWEPPEGRFSLRLGRLRLGSYAGVGTLDGVAFESRIAGGFHLGVFGGSPADLSELGIDSAKTSYGVLARWASSGPGPRREVVVAGVREDGEIDVSREYVALQSRLGRGRWTFYQRAEFDLNNGWREAASGGSSQLSTLFANLIGRVSDRNRLSLSYSRFERYRTEDTRFIPEELFDESRRQGLRARWTIGRPGGLNVSLSAGLREKDGSDEDQTSAGIGVAHHDLFGRRWSVGLDLLSFTGTGGDGVTARLSVGKRLRGGHRLRLTAGSRVIEDPLLGFEDRETVWIRLGGWFELPGALYGRLEVESLSGEVLEGQRVLAGFGYRL